MNSNLVLSAFKHWDKVDSVDDEASPIPIFFCLPTSEYSSNPPVVANFDGNKSSTANPYGNGDGTELNPSSTAQVEGWFNIVDGASSMPALFCSPL